MGLALKEIFINFLPVLTYFDDFQHNTVNAAEQDMSWSLDETIL